MGRRRPWASNGDSGVTYLESMLVLLLAGVVLALGVPSFRQYSSNQRAHLIARTLASDLRVAQQEAVTRRADVAVAFSNASAACRNAPSYEISAGAVMIKRSCFSSDVAWAVLPATLTWDPTGMTVSAATLSVRSALTGRTYNVWVAAQTGAITDDTR